MRVPLCIICLKMCHFAWTCVSEYSSRSMVCPVLRDARSYIGTWGLQVQLEGGNGGCDFNCLYSVIARAGMMVLMAPDSVRPPLAVVGGRPRPPPKASIQVQHRWGALSLIFKGPTLILLHQIFFKCKRGKNTQVRKTEEEKDTKTVTRATSIGKANRSCVCGSYWLCQYVLAMLYTSMAAV